MPGKIYVKDESFDPIYKSTNYGFLFKSRILSGALMSLGFLVLGTQVVIPLVFFKTSDHTTKSVESSVLGIATGFSEFEFDELKGGNNEKVNEPNIPEYFTISIPRLGIEDAIVETESSNLSPEESLGHYKGSALPGVSGNTFIYGHSVLPWFYNPNNYKTIFSTLGDLEAGDEILIKYNNNEMKYKVEREEVKYPSEINPLALIKPAYLNEATMTLMTCWPAGTKTKRLMIYSTLVN